MFTYAHGIRDLEAMTWNPEGERVCLPSSSSSEVANVADGHRSVSPSFGVLPPLDPTPYICHSGKLTTKLLIM